NLLVTQFSTRLLLWRGGIRMQVTNNEPIILFDGLSIHEGLRLIEWSIVLWSEYLAMKENGDILDLDNVLHASKTNIPLPSRNPAWPAMLKRRREELLHCFYNRI